MNEVEELQGLESACRLCLTTDETRSSIFGSTCNVEPLIEKIHNCLSLHISQEDKLSTLICITCVTKVNQWHQYKNACLQSQGKLLEWLAKQSEPLPVVTVKQELEEDCIEHLESVKIPEKISEKQININEQTNIPEDIQPESNSSPIEITENGETEPITEQEINNQQVNETQTNNESTNPTTQMDIESEPRDAVKRKLSKDFDNEPKRFNPIPIKMEPDSDLDLVHENHLMDSPSMENETEVTKTQKMSLKGRKKMRRGPHTHFRGARIFKRKCMHCQINLHSKTSYAKHMARFHTQKSRLNLEKNEKDEKEMKEMEEMVEDVEEELENLEEDAPLTPVQQNIISQLKTFTCYSCEQSFDDRSTTLNHIRQHMPDLRQFTCVACLTEFGDQNTYKQHCEASFECAMKIALVVPVQGTEKYFTCNMCLNPLSNRKELLSHLTKHSDKQYEELRETRAPPKLTPIAPIPKSSLPYGMGDPAYNHECDLCGMIYRYKPNMIKHRELCASLQPEGRTSYKCIDCGMTFLIFSKFHSHVTIEHKKKELKCPKCAAKFRSPSDYLTHHEFHRKKNNLKDPQVWKNPQEEEKLVCSFCNQRFGTKIELNEHKNLHLKVKIYSCVICRSMFSSPGALEIHMKDHGIEDPNERTANSSCLEYESKSQEKVLGKTECECGKIFSNVANLKRHIRNAHEEKKIDCQICNRSFKSKESLEEHQRTHNIERTVIPCPECPKTFVFQANLDIHLQNIHSKGHECEICGKTFAEESSLKIHRGWHNRANSRLSQSFEIVKPAKARKSFPNPFNRIQLQCQVCDDKFQDVGDLRKHVWDVHCARTGNVSKQEVNNYECEVCKNMFPDQETLEVHMEWHERNPNFRCEICDKYYSSRKILWRHKKLHKVSQVPSYQKFQSLSMKKSSQCHCGRTFTSESALKRHKATSPECQRKTEKPVTCHICKSVFPSMSILYQHKQLVHKVTKERTTECIPITNADGVKCNICGKQFSGLSNLKQHFAMKHKSVSTHPCTVANCKMVFSTPHALKSHELQHSNMIFSCTLCEKHFFHRGIMEKHIYNAHRAVYESIGNDKDVLFKETDLTSYTVKGANGTVCPRCKIKYPNCKAMKIHYFKFHENLP